MFETYEFSQSNIYQLNANLGPSQVEGLASEVIRRLAAKEYQFPDVLLEPTDDWLSLFCRALVSQEDDAAVRFVTDLHAGGVPAEEVYIKHIAAAARLLGEWWLDDHATFAEVTLASVRLIAIMRSMRPFFAPARTKLEKSAFFASVPGETHTLGIHMASDLMRMEGWNITLQTGLDHDQLVAAIETSDCNIIGLSMSGAHSIDALARLVVALHVSCPHVPIIVSGSEIRDQRPKVELMCVDGIADTFDDAKIQMNTLCQMRSD